MRQSKFNQLMAVMMPLGVGALSPMTGAYSYLTTSYRTASKENYLFSDFSDNNKFNRESLSSINPFLELPHAHQSLQLLSYKNDFKVVEQYPAVPLEIASGMLADELVIVDKGVANYSTLLQGIKANAEIRFIDNTKPGLEQLNEILQLFNGLQALHLISHAGDGYIQLGKDKVELSELTTANNVDGLKSAIKPGGDIFFYGCNLAKSGNGQETLALLSHQTSLDIAASNDLTGHDSMGGDWDLEVKKGDVKSAPLFDSKALLNFDDVLGFSGNLSLNNLPTGYAAAKSYVVPTTSYTFKVVSDPSGANNLYNFVSGYVYAGTVSSTNNKTYLYFSNNETFDVTSIYVYNASGGTKAIRITSDKGGAMDTPNLVSNSGATINVSGANWEGITKLAVKYPDDSTLSWLKIDDIVVANVTAANSAPTDIGLDSSSINDIATSSGAVIGNLSTTDTDGGDTHTYSLVSDGASDNGSCGASGDDDNASFQVDNTNDDLETSGSVSSGSYDVCVQTSDGTASYQESFTITVNNFTDSDGDVTAAGGVSEPIGLDTTVDTVGEALGVFDFTISDGGTSDGKALTVSAITVNVSGTASDTVRDQLTWRLNGNDASNVTGVYNAGSDTITFSGLSISVADGASETYTVNAYYNDNTNLTEDHTFILSVDGDTDLTIGGSGTQMGTTSALTNGSGSTVDVTATALAFTTQPAGSTSGSVLSTQPVVMARDAFGNIDVDFTETITVTEASAGTLSGDTDITAVSGVATFTDVVYSATADQQSFTLTANDEDGVGSDLSTVDANAVTSDVVASKLVFDTQPAPLTVQSGIAESFTTVPVVSAVDANNVIDTGYSTDITLAENGAGTATMTGTGDTDGNGATVSITPSSGVSTFTGLNITYTGASSNETFTLRAISGGLTLTDSSNITSQSITITLATYDANNGVVVATGTGFTANGGGADVDASLMTLTGEGGATYTLTDTADVEIDSTTQFTLTLSATDKAAVNQIMNKNGSSSTGGTSYNLNAADDFITVVTSGDTSDATSAITVSNVVAPSISLAAYDYSTNVLSVSGSGFLKSNGAANDIDVSMLTVTGEGGSTYTFASSSDVEISSGTSFSVTLSGADIYNVEALLNKDGTTSATSATSYNLAAAEDWNIGADATVNIADLTGNSVTVSNYTTPSVTSSSYDWNTGQLVITASELISLSGGSNDIDASLLSVTGEGGSYTLTDTADVEITSDTLATVTLSATDKLNVHGLLNKNGTVSSSAVTYNLAAADDWVAGAPVGNDIADLTSNAITASNVCAPSITSVAYDVDTGVVTVAGSCFYKKVGASNDIDVSAFTFTGGVGDQTYTLTSATDIELTSATSFSFTLTGADKTNVDALLDQLGGTSSGGSTYNVAVAEDWMTAADAATNIADTTIGTSVEVSPQLASAVYNPDTGVLIVTGSNIQANGGGSDIDASMLSITGETGASYGLTDTADVERDSITQFTLTLSATDKSAVNALLNNTGNQSADNTSYNLAAADDWNTSVTSGDTSDASAGITVANTAPSFNGLNGDSVSYIVGGNDVVLDNGGNVTLTDLTTSELNGGSLTVSIIANAQAAEDLLKIGDLGTISTSGSNVNHSDSGGLIIGTFTGGSAGTDLVISLNNNATLTRVQQLVSAIEYANSDNSTLNLLARTVRIYLDDGEASNSSSSNQDITVNLIRAPLIDLDSDNSSGASNNDFTTNYSEGGSAVALADSDVTISDDGSYKAVIATLTNRPDGANETLSSTLGSGSQVVNSESVTVSSYNAANGELSVTIDDASADSTTMQAIIQSIQYANSSGEPNTTIRAIEFIATDNDDNQGPVAVARVSILSVNDSPTGSVLISGSAVEDQILNASNTLADADGLGVISYQWLRNDVVISGATGSSYGLGDEDVGSNIKVRASYTDGQGTAESVTSNATAVVANINDIPSGGVTISGTTHTGQVLTASNTLADDDGLGDISYQWFRDEIAIAGATGASYTLVLDDVGTQISVQASFTDGNGTFESVGSEQTAVVEFSNQAPIAKDSHISLDEDTSISFELDISDPNQDELTVSVTTGPTVGELVQQDSGWLYTPNANFHGEDSFSYQVSDGQLTSAVASVTITVNPVNDAPQAQDDSFTINTDSGEYQPLDVQANDSDIDGDDLSIYQASADIGTVEVINNLLNYLPPKGYNGSAKLNYIIQDVAGAQASAEAMLTLASAVSNISITPPADVTVNASGLFTQVNMGTAIATNEQGNNIPVSVDATGFFAPGHHIVSWSAVEGDSQVAASQNVNVIPLISLSKDQVSTEGSNVNFRVILNGPAVTYPVTVSFNLSGNADELDHDLVPATITFEQGQIEKVLSAHLIDDGPGEDNEALVISLTEPENAVLGAKASHTITIAEGNIAPEVQLMASQLNTVTRLVSQTQGPVVVNATVTDPNLSDSHSYDWSATDSKLTDIDADEGSFTFEPAELTPGVYPIKLTVSDGEKVGQDSLKIRVEATLPQLTEQDSDGDGINDQNEGLGDSDNDGIPNYLDAAQVAANVVQERQANAEAFLMETEPGLMLSLGEVAFRASGSNTGVSEQDIESHSNQGQGNPIDSDFSYGNGLFDFSVEQLPVAGQSVNIVIAQFTPIPANAVYRKLAQGQWQNFVVNEFNNISSAPGSEGFCPPPADEAYTIGLTEGHWCVQLTIEDGGPNDGDGEVNGAIDDPGGIAVQVTNNNKPVAEVDTVTVKSNHNIYIDVLANDSDIDGDNLSITSASSDIGQVSIVDNRLYYLTEQDHYGEAHINYGISDGNGGSASSKVTVTVLPNNIPVAVNDSAETDDNTSIIIDVLVNDSDADEEDTLILTAASVEHGSVVINSDNTLTYTPVKGFEGVDNITYWITDGSGGESQANVAVTVTRYETITVTKRKSSGGGSLFFGLISLVLALMYRRYREYSNKRF
ncbi:hypothetical protein tinsulaeT_35000 [Thalassotalea insulae]|uniref:DUF4347 domain-containing protein n=1 Tax=Thalassotalea insulae TaxID=2056778 RepID=A0ABQ6GW75_9GAMM|nr:Ig-like domain-containing protein [Thalassotalea insulae]GLX80160.1 hypothetical protein tinsulaeT_35000 [Thalassotalea insulae]